MKFLTAKEISALTDDEYQAYRSSVTLFLKNERNIYFSETQHKSFSLSSSEDALDSYQAGLETLTSLEETEKIRHALVINEIQEKRDEFLKAIDILVKGGGVECVTE